MNGFFHVPIPPLCAIQTTCTIPNKGIEDHVPIVATRPRPYKVGVDYRVHVVWEFRDRITATRQQLKVRRNSSPSDLFRVEVPITDTKQEDDKDSWIFDRCTGKLRRGVSHGSGKRLHHRSNQQVSEVFSKAAHLVGH